MYKLDHISSGDLDTIPSGAYIDHEVAVYKDGTDTYETILSLTEYFKGYKENSYRTDAKAWTVESTYTGNYFDHHHEEKYEKYGITKEQVEEFILNLNY